MLRDATETLEPQVRFDPLVERGVHVSHILNQAADLIEQGKWLRFMESDGYGGYCAIGAIFAAGGGSKTAIAFRRTLKVNITTWNDRQSPRRGKKRVVKKLRKAAKKYLP